MLNSPVYIAVVNPWPSPAEAFTDVKELALPKAFEFFAVLTTVLVVALIIKSLRK
jgi:hypothetical protein